jgi:hypothetical protein
MNLVYLIQKKKFETSATGKNISLIRKVIINTDLSVDILNKIFTLVPKLEELHFRVTDKYDQNLVMPLLQKFLDLKKLVITKLHNIIVHLNLLNNLTEIEFDCDEQFDNVSFINPIRLGVLPKLKNLNLVIISIRD